MAENYRLTFPSAITYRAGILMEWTHPSDFGMVVIT